MQKRENNYKPDIWETPPQPWKSQLSVPIMKFTHIHRFSYQHFCVWDFNYKHRKRLPNTVETVSNEKVTDLNKKELWRNRDNEVEVLLPPSHKKTYNQ